MGVRARWGALCALLIGLLVPHPAQAQSATTSRDIPTRRAPALAVLRTSTADALVQVNVDIGMAVRAGTSCRSSYPGACKGATYHPCFNPRDPAYGGCQTYTFYRVVPPGVDLARGIVISSATGAVNHEWARKLTEAHLEVYAADPAGRFGDIRLRVASFPHVDPLGHAAYSDEIGHLNLPLLGAQGTGWIEGTAVGARGRPMPPRSFKLDVFGHTDTGRRTGLTGQGGFVEYGFGRAAVEDGVTDGSFRTRPLFTGTYDVHVQRKGASFSCQVRVRGGALRLDLDFSKPRLGHPGCTPLQPLARTVPG